MKKKRTPWWAITLMTAAVLIMSAVGAILVHDNRPSAAVKPAPSAVARLDVGGGHGSAVHIGHGLFLTATHVIRNEATVNVVLSDDSRTPAEVLWASDVYDVALVRVETFKDPPKTATLACALLKVGDAIHAVGNPFDLGPTITRGTIAGGMLSRSLWRETMVADMAVGAGMSGGPVFGAAGELRGIVVGALGGYVSPFVFIVPSSTICRLLGRSA